MGKGKWTERCNNNNMNICSSSGESKKKKHTQQTQIYLFVSSLKESVVWTSNTANIFTLIHDCVSGKRIFCVSTLQVCILCLRKRFFMHAREREWNERVDTIDWLRKKNIKYILARIFIYARGDNAFFVLTFRTFFISCTQRARVCVSVCLFVSRALLSFWLFLAFFWFVLYDIFFSTLSWAFFSLLFFSFVLGFQHIFAFHLISIEEITWELKGKSCKCETFGRFSFLYRA